MILALRGHPADVPEWVEVLLLAEAWHMAPNEIEDKVPDIWVQRQRTLEHARMRALKAGRNPVGSVEQRADGTTATRLV